MPLAYSEGCRNQAFKIGRMMGLQFHLETTEESMRALWENAADELESAISSKAKYVQTKEQMLAAGKRYIPQANALLKEFLNAILV